MGCQDVERNELVARYLSGHLESDIQDDFELHLLECRTCQSSLEVMVATRDDLVARAHEIRSYSPSRSMRLRWVWVAAATLTLILCSLGTFWLLLHHPGHSQIAHQKGQAPPTDSPQQTAKTEISDSRPSLHLEDLSSQTPKERARTGSSQGHESVANPQNPNAGTKVFVENSPVPMETAKPKEGEAGLVDMLPILSPADTSGWPEEKREQLARLAEVTPPTYTFSTSSIGFVDRIKPGPGNQELAQRLFEDGILAYVDKRYGKAEKLLDQAYRLAPTSKEISFYLGICKLMNGKGNEARPLLTVSEFDIGGKDTPYAQAAHFYIGKSHLQMGFLESAEIEFKEAAALPGELKTDAQSAATELQGLLAIAKQEKVEKSNKPN